MSLTGAQGPLGPEPAGWFSREIPRDLVYVEPHCRRIQAVHAGRTLIDTERALLVHRPLHPLSYAFPKDVVGDLPCVEVREAPGFWTMPWDAVDTWVEEGRQLVNYPLNPYHRVDCRPTSRRLRVEVNGVVVVDTTDTVIVFETSLDARLYVHPEQVRAGLIRSAASSYCNYKGVASYWSVVVDGVAVADGAWSYESAFPESKPIEGLLSFDSERCDVQAELPVGQHFR